MRRLVGLHRHHNPKRRRNRGRRQRDGLTNHDRAVTDTSRREINDFANRLQEIRDRDQDITWAQEGPADRKKFVFAFRNAKFSRYGGNNKMLLNTNTRNQISHIREGNISKSHHAYTSGAMGKWGKRTN